MLSFKQFIKESRDAWDKIDSHYHSLPEPIKRHIDYWTGLSPDQVKRGLESGPMIPRHLEQNWREVHAANEPLRNTLRRHYGETITAYRGTVPGENPSTGRQKELESWTTSKRVAETFAGTPTSKRMKEYSPEEISVHVKNVERDGRTHLPEIGMKLIKNPHGTIDIHKDSVGGYLTDTKSVESFFDDHNESAREYNSRFSEAEKNVQRKEIPVSDVVHATNHMGQEELVVKNQ